MNKEKTLIKLRSKMRNKSNPKVDKQKRAVELYSWSPKNGRENFGDHISGAIVRKMLALRDLDIDEISSDTKQLLSVGSIMHFAKEGATIWGTGVNGKVNPQLHKFNNLDVRAVRGPLTREYLISKGIKCPEIYGDPAILTRKLFQRRFSPKEAESKTPYIIIPNLHDLTKVEGFDNVVSPFDSWSNIIEKVINSEAVISTSLHGIILAESFGVPAILLRLSETETIFKYEDYYLGTGRSTVLYTTSLNEAKSKIGLTDPPKFEIDRLSGAFPYDLWEKQ